MTEYISIKDTGAVVKELKPHNPIHTFRPKSLEKAARCFLNGFNGKVLYAVKTNPMPHVLQALSEHGIANFDVASLGEIKLVRSLLPDANLYFMHTVKSRHSINEAYHKYGVRNFALDSEYELTKILEETNYAKDINLHVRMAIPNNYAELSLADKFGVNLVDAPALLKKVRQHANKLGMCFHVGSQCMHPDAYRIAIRMLRKTATEAGVKIDVLDVGGGFPSIYPGMHPLDMQEFFDVIHKEFDNFRGESEIELFCEPGRALVAESGAVIVRVELRKGEHLYINDGTYGSLFDAGTPNFVFPVKLIRINGEQPSNNVPFSFFGPTCDSIDYMKGPFYLPDDVREGDYIEIGQLGAYGKTMATSFNGFRADEVVYSVTDEPLMTMYGENPSNGDDEVKVVAA